MIIFRSFQIEANNLYGECIDSQKSGKIVNRRSHLPYLNQCMVLAIEAIKKPTRENIYRLSSWTSGVKSQSPSWQKFMGISTFLVKSCAKISEFLYGRDPLKCSFDTVEKDRIIKTTASKSMFNALDKLTHAVSKQQVDDDAPTQMRRRR